MTWASATAIDPGWGCSSHVNDNFRSADVPGMVIAESPAREFHDHGSCMSGMPSRGIHHPASYGARPDRQMRGVRLPGPEQLLVTYAPAARTRYHRLVLRFGGYRNPAAKKRAIVAIAHTLTVIIWHMLTTGAPYADLGPDFYARPVDPDQEARRLISRLEAPGRKVTLEPAA